MRAKELTHGKDVQVLGYLAEAQGLSREFGAAAETARQGLALSPVTSGSSPNRLQQWLLDEIAEYSERRRRQKSRPLHC